MQPGSWLGIASVVDRFNVLASFFRQCGVRKHGRVTGGSGSDLR